MNTRLTQALAVALTTAVTFISFFGAVPAQAQTTSLTRSGIVALANTDRASAGEHKVAEDWLLDAAAQAKANDMAAKGYFSHVDPSGNQPWMWFKKFGYYYWGAAENLAVNFYSNSAVNTAWMNSPSHRENLLNGSYSRMGIGIAQGTYNGQPATFIVQFFADPYIGPGSKVAML